MSDFNREYLYERLDSGCGLLGIEVPKERLQILIEYLFLLQKWNKAMNLTSIQDPDSMVVRHLLDSLSVIPYVTGRRVLDVGSGAGLPGIPLAVVSPEKEITLLDSLKKRTHFLVQVTAELGLQNTDVVHCRVENYNARHEFDVVVSRAFSCMNDFAAKTARYCKPGGRLLAMKGRFPAEELEMLNGNYKVLAVRALNVPGLAAERHVVEIDCGK